MHWITAFSCLVMATLMVVITWAERGFSALTRNKNGCVMMYFPKQTGTHKLSPYNYMVCVSLNIIPVLFCITSLLYHLHNEVVGGYIGFTLSIPPSVCPSVRPSRIPCMLCSTYSSGWIHFIFIHLIKQFPKVCRVFGFLQHLKIWIFGNFFKICNFDFVFFWLGIWCESLVWVIMGQQGVSQNAGVLVVLVMLDKCE